MWRHLLPALASAGRRALAPDLPGFGDSSPDPPGTYERHVEAVERFRRQIGLDQVVLVVHDTGGLIGLRWACDHPDAVAGLVITNTGFFPDHEWIEIAKTMRTPIQGEALVDSLSREGFATLLEAASTELDEPPWTSTGRRSPRRRTGAACSSSIAPSTSTSSSPTREARGTRGADADPVGTAGRVPAARLRVTLREGDSRLQARVVRGCSPFPLRGRAGALRPRGNRLPSASGHLNDRSLVRIQPRHVGRSQALWCRFPGEGT